MQTHRFRQTCTSLYCLLLFKYRGAAHNACNLLLKIDPRQYRTPVVFHNLLGYDSHFLIANLGKSAYKQNYVVRNGLPQTKIVGDVSVIANNMERFMSFTWNRFHFIDLCQFLSASLDRLVSTTPDDAFTLSSTFYVVLNSACLTFLLSFYIYKRLDEGSPSSPTRLLSLKQVSVTSRSVQFIPLGKTHVGQSYFVTRYCTH